MKKITSLIFLTLFSFNYLATQETISDTDKLVSLGRMYGFLKYYHPKVATGSYDWDNEFLQQLPKVLNTEDKISLSKVYMDWLGRLGPIEICKKCDSDDVYFNKNFDLSWTQDSAFFSSELSSKLNYIEKNRAQGKNFYVSTEPVGQIKITNEKTYDNFEYPNEAYRLLGLFKYWNIIEYFYPYKYLTDQNWDAVLKEMIPKMRNVTNQDDYQLAIKELISKLDDSHAWIVFENKKDWKQVPIIVSTIENKPVVSGFYNDSIAQQNNLKLGDIILTINDKNFESETKTILKYISGSNENHNRYLAYPYLLWGKESNLTLTIERNNEVLDIKVNRYPFATYNYLGNKRKLKSTSINDDTGYINMASRFNRKDIDNIFKSFENKKAIIIDLRNYPDFMYNMFSRHLNSKKRDFAKIIVPNLNYPGKFKFKENMQTAFSKKVFKGKVILLVNEVSLSLSEFTAMAFQTADNVTTIGSQTAGADGESTKIEYLGGFRTAISGTGIFYPDGSETQRKGVKIDIIVKPTIKGITEGRDEVLEKAIELASK